MLPQAGAGGEGARASMEESQALLAEGKGLGLQLRGLPRLITLLAQARAWNVRAQRALRSGAPRPQCYLTVSPPLSCHPLSFETPS
jgi:hypothetical protein